MDNKLSEESLAAMLLPTSISVEGMGYLVKPTIYQHQYGGHITDLSGRSVKVQTWYKLGSTAKGISINQPRKGSVYWPHDGMAYITWLW